MSQVLRLRTRHIAGASSAATVQSYDDTALLKRIDELERRLEVSLQKNADLLKALGERPEADEKPTAWDFKIEKDSSGAIRSVRAVAVEPDVKKPEPDVGSVFYGKG